MFNQAGTVLFSRYFNYCRPKYVYALFFNRYRIVVKLCNSLASNRCAFLCLVFLCAASISIVHGQIFVVNSGTNTIGEYNLDGSTVNASLISVTNEPVHIEVAASTIFVSSAGLIGAYTLSGTTVNTSLITGIRTSAPYGFAASSSNIFAFGSGGSLNKYGLDGSLVTFGFISGLTNAPIDIGVSGSDIYVLNQGFGSNPGSIGLYSSTGSAINSSLVSGLNQPSSFAVSSSAIFVFNQGNFTVGEYGLDGSTVNASLITGLNNTNGIAVLGQNLLVTNAATGEIEEYNSSGTLLTSSFISGLSTPFSLAVVPEPDAKTLLLEGLVLLAAFKLIRMSRPFKAKS